MRVLHTADWHLGKTLRGLSLHDDQAHVLDQIFRTIVAEKIDLLIVAGTTVTTTLPSMIIQHFSNYGKPVINIDIEEGTASDMARFSNGGGFIKGPSAEILPELVDLL